LYSAQRNPVNARDASDEPIRAEDEDRNADQMNAKLLAEQSGGRAFANSNSLSDVIAQVTSNSAHFYTLSYSPTEAKMDGGFRKIEVKVKSGKYNLSYRRGYFALEGALPGSAITVRDQQLKKMAAQNSGRVDPLLPYMDLGMPQNQQIVFKLHIAPAMLGGKPAQVDDKSHYQVDLTIDPKDLDLNLGALGQHTGALNVSLVVYDRYANIVTREDHLVQLDIKPESYAALERTGVQLHARLAIRKGKYWLRTGIYDQRSHHVGTIEIPITAVKLPEQAAR